MCKLRDTYISITIDLASKYRQTARQLDVVLKSPSLPRSAVFDQTSDGEGDENDAPAADSINSNHNVDLNDITSQNDMTEDIDPKLLDLYKVNDTYYTASDGSVKEIFGLRRYVFSCAFGFKSDRNFADSLTGPQNITVCELLGAAICLTKTNQIEQFRLDPYHRHIIDNLNAFTYLTELQRAVRNATHETNILFLLMTEVAPWTDTILDLVSIFTTRNNLTIVWQPSHTDSDSHEAIMNDAADYECERYMSMIYTAYPRAINTDEELQRRAQLPPEQRRLR